MFKVCIDPGHCGIAPGFDPGAVGHGGAKEADIVLKVGKKLRELLKDKFNILLTREADDESVDELWTRVKMAEDFSADLFISLHCNAAEAMQAHGYEAWIYTGDSVSVPLAESIMESFESNFPDMTNRGIKEARFGVLKGDFPSVLMELAFITNPVEEAFLLSDFEQDKMAEAIAEGILKWIEKTS